jgi:putative FmdB family regulatory protein
MPLYEYQCEACGTRFEKIQKFSDPPIDVCPTCGKGPVNKLVSSPAIQFKGSGWYITDYAKKSSPESSSSKTGGDGGSESKKAETPAASWSTSEKKD